MILTFPSSVSVLTGFGISDFEFFSPLSSPIESKIELMILRGLNEVLNVLFEVVGFLAEVLLGFERLAKLPRPPVPLFTDFFLGAGTSRLKSGKMRILHRDSF